MDSVYRRSMAALILIAVVVRAIPTAEGQEQKPEPVIGVDVEAEAIAAPKSVQPAPDPPVPVELVPICRLYGTLDGLVRLKDRCVHLAASEKPIQNCELLEMVASIQEELQSNGVTDSDNGKFMLDLFLAVPTNGSTETNFAYGFSYPFGRTELLKMFGNDPEFAATLSAADDGYAAQDEMHVLVREQRSVFLALESPMAVADSRAILNQLLKDTEAHRSLAVAELIFEPRKSVHKLRKPFLDAMLAAYNTDLQRRDDEDELAFRFRDVQGKSVASLIDLLLNQLEQVRLALFTDDGTDNVRWDLEIRAVAGSELDGWIQRQEKCRNRVIRGLHPDHAAFLSVSLAIPETLQTLLPALSQPVCDRLVSENVITAGTGRQLNDALRQLTGASSIELLLQTMTNADGEVSVIATIPFAEPAAISAATIEMISYTKDSRWQTNWVEIDGAPVHRMSGIQPGDLLDLNQQPKDLCLVMGERQLVLQVAPPGSTSLLASVVRQDFPEHELAPRLSRSGLSLGFRVQDSRWLADSDRSGLEELLYGRKLAQDEQPQDQISVAMLHDPHTITLRTTFERDATVAGVTSYLNLVFQLLEQLE